MSEGPLLKLLKQCVSIDNREDLVFRSKIAKVILNLLRNDMNQLVQLLYKLDISEKKAKVAFSLLDDKQISLELAKIIMEREFLRLDFRRNYSQP